MTDEELIAQLKNSKGWPTLGKAAATRIEALTAERDALKQIAADHVLQELEQAARADKAEAKLTKAVEGLQAFKAFDEMPTRYKRPDVFEVSVRRKLLSALAEIEGEKR